MKKKIEDDILDRLTSEVIPPLEAIIKAGRDQPILPDQQAIVCLQTFRARVERERATSKNQVGADQSALAEMNFHHLTLKEIKTLCAAFRRFEIRRARYRQQSAKASETARQLIESGAGENILSARSQNAAKARETFDGNEQKLFDRASSGGKSRKESLSSTERSDIAKRAAQARWHPEEKTESENRADEKK